MAKKIKKVSVSKIDYIHDTTFSNSTVEEWNGVEVLINKSISLSDMLSFVADVVSKCFDENGDYYPELMDFAIKENILTRYASFTMPKNIDKRYDFLYQTDAVEFVCGHINVDQLKDIVESIECKLEYVRESDIMFIRSKFSSLIDSIESLQSKAEDLFSGVTKEDVSKVIGCIGSGMFDEAKLVRAYTDVMEKTRSDTGDVSE